jgi:hypothetical protein
MIVIKLFPLIATPFKFAIRHTIGFALIVAIAAVLSASTAQAQNTQVTIEGSITSVGSVPGIIVGDKYSMVVYYNPTQAPASTMGALASYTAFTLNAVVDDKDGNQNFSAESGEQLEVRDGPTNNLFVSGNCCNSPAAAAFELGDNTNGTPPFKTNALPTALNLKDFDSAIVLFGDTASGSNAQGSITSIRVVDTAGVIPAFISAGAIDPNGKVPAANVVPGSGVNNLDISFPLMLLTHGNSYVFTVALQDIDFTGTCQASYTLTQIQFNKTVTLDSAKDGTFSCNPGTIWFWTFTGNPIPDFPGPATLTGTVTYGTTKATVVSTVVIN